MRAEDVVKVSTKGQIVIPKGVRRRFGIKPGKRLLVAVGRNEILLRKVEELSLQDISRRIDRVVRRERIDVDALAEEAIRWARKSR